MFTVEYLPTEDARKNDVRSFDRSIVLYATRFIQKSVKIQNYRSWYVGILTDGVSRLPPSSNRMFEGSVHSILFHAVFKCKYATNCNMVMSYRWLRRI